MSAADARGAAGGNPDLGFVHRFEPGPRRETILVLHGTGGDESDLLPLARTLAPGANLLSPRGPVLENGMPRFFRRLAMGVFDGPDLIRRAGDLSRFVQEAGERYGFDRSRVQALGYSNGANVAAAVLLLHSEALAGGVLLRAVLPLRPPETPNLDGKSVLLAAGRHDPYAPPERVEALASLLREAGAGVDLRWADAGHELDPAELEAARTWLAGAGG